MGKWILKEHDVKSWDWIQLTAQCNPYYWE